MVDQREHRERHARHHDRDEREHVREPQEFIGAVPGQAGDPAGRDLDRGESAEDLSRLIVPAPGVPEQGWSGKLIQDWAVQGLDESQRRRPQWRGERKAVLVRVPVALADDLARSAALERRSVSEHVTILLTQVMQGQDGT